MKTIRHKWVALPGFKRHKCERCNCIRLWNEGYGKVVFYDRYGKLYPFTPSCELPNVKLN